MNEVILAEEKFNDFYNEKLAFIYRYCRIVTSDLVLRTQDAADY